MSRLELLGSIDDQHRLTAIVPNEMAPGPVKVILEVPDEEQGDWSAAIALAWSSDWSDPREDIYSLEDGEPVVGPK